ncbi:MAG TPA: ATP-binding protein [Kofleriaceae bacterium]|nr:ATP-binding protein [Kofleriaceae bacterium]
MALVSGDDPRASSEMPAAREPLPFKRRFLIPGVVLGALEALLVGLPLWNLFDLGRVPPSTLLRIAIPVIIGAALVWTAALTTWLLPVRTAVVLRRRGDRVPKELSARAYRATLRVPLRALILRTAVWTGVAAAIGSFLVEYSGWTWPTVAAMTSLAALHSCILAGARAVWLGIILGDVRVRLFAISSPLRRFGDAYYRRLVMVATVVASGTLGAQAAFLYYFVPIGHDAYLAIETYMPLAVCVSICLWAIAARFLTRDFRDYLEAAQGETGEPAAGASATDVYKKAQGIPYRLALVSVALWSAIGFVGGLIARWHLRLELDDTAIMVAATMVVAVGASIYESLWHRETMRPLLAHLTVRYRVPVRGIAPSLSLRSKLLMSFGGVILLACGMALLWGFVQYKNFSTEAVDRQADLGLAWLRSVVQAEAASRQTPPDPDLVREVIRDIGPKNPNASAVVYYYDDGGPVDRGGGDIEQSKGEGPEAHAGGGIMGAPRLPWYTIDLMRRRNGGAITLGPAKLAGRVGRLRVPWRGKMWDLGGVAVLYPDYRGRGENMVRPLKELMIFFLVLFGACAGIVAVTVAQFVAPIRRLEQRADAMARGELADPVSSGGEGDEIGRLTFALEEMRRALREKLRSTEEVNLDLERAVQKRTADLAKKNKELAETLDKLTRAQNQLVRSEKLASIGQLVAGIAHEINNPVNAIVNTVGPLDEAIGSLTSSDSAARDEAAGDIREMVRVVQRGAQRTKAIVQALHNYSRTDDENLVDFDLNRSLDDSLELLRHLLKGTITVERRYGEVGRIRAHAGQINQVFMNLLTNAAQALGGRDDAKITIDTIARDEHVVVKIGDNGPGIPAEVLPRIWDPFFTTKDVGEGTGLGLSIVHELVERHGGTIEVETSLGAGTTFVVTLPRRTSDLRRERQRSSTQNERIAKG